MEIVFMDANLQPDLSGNPFLSNLRVLLNGKRRQKRLGAEGGKAAIKRKLKTSRFQLSDIIYFTLSR